MSEEEHQQRQHVEHVEVTTHETHVADAHPPKPKMQWNPKESWRSFNQGLSSFGVNMPLMQSVFNKHFGHLLVRLNDFYDHTPVRIADFKRNYILNLGDERIRLILLSLLSIPIWKIANYRSSNAPLLRYRNLALTFVGLGIILTPEIFNPFLSEYRTAPAVVATERAAQRP